MKLPSGLIQLFLWKEFTANDLIKKIEKGNLGNKGVSPLSYNVLIGGMAVGFITAVAGYILGNLPLFACGCLLFIANGLGTRMIRLLKTEKTFSENSKDTHKEIENLGIENNKIHEENNQLEMILAKSKNLATQYTEQLSESNNQIEALTRKIAELDEKEKVELNKLKNIEKIYPPLSKNLAEYFSRAKKIITTSTKEDQIYDNLIESIKTFNFSKPFLERDINEFRVHAQSTQQLCAKLDPTLRVIKEVWNNLMESVEDIELARIKMKKQSSEIRRLNTNLENQIDDIETTEDKYNKHEQELRKLIAANTKTIETLQQQLSNRIKERSRSSII